MNNFENLKNLTRDQLVALAGKQGLAIHHRNSAETIIKMIVDAQQPQVKPEAQQQSAKPKIVESGCTKEQVEAMLAPIKARLPQFVSEYPDDGTWVFKCKGAEESGNLVIPMKVIKARAEAVAVGKLQLMGVTDHFDKTSAGGNSFYTNSVLTV